MEHKITYSELLQMIVNHNEPKKIRCNNLEFEMIAFEYRNHDKDITLEQYLVRYPTRYIAMNSIIYYEDFVLDATERLYLRNVILPFRHDVVAIVKTDLINIREQIEIFYRKEGFDYYMFFPPFKKGKMYKGMEPNKLYTLKDLEL